MSDILERRLILKLFFQSIILFFLFYNSTTKCPNPCSKLCAGESGRCFRATNYPVCNFLFVIGKVTLLDGKLLWTLNDKELTNVRYSMCIYISKCVYITAICDTCKLTCVIWCVPLSVPFQIRLYEICSIQDGKTGLLWGLTMWW